MVPDGLYKILGQYKDDIHWFCRSCQATAGKLFMVILQIQKKVDHLEKEQLRLKKELQAEFTQSITLLDKALASTNARLSDLEKLVQHTTGDVISAVDERIKDQIDKKFDKSCVDEHGKVSFAAVLTKEVGQKFAEVGQATEQLREEKEIVARSNNLVFYLVPESDFATHRTRIEEDRKFIDDLCNDVFGVPLAENDVSNMYRLGKNPTEAAQRQDHPRPLLVTMKDYQTKQRIMANVSCLRDIGNRYAPIGVAHDLTPHQRAENKSLLDKARQDLVAEQKDPKNYRLFIVTRENQRVVVTKLRH